MGFLSLEGLKLYYQFLLQNELVNIRLNILAIILPSVLSSIAIIVSIITIKKQITSQNINSTIALFDKRFEIYNYVYNAWYIIGYFESILDNLFNTSKHNYKELIIVNKIDYSHDMLNRINIAYSCSSKYENMEKLLFSNKTRYYLGKFLSAFSIYINGIYHKSSIDKDLCESSYLQIMELLDTKDFDMEELRQFLDLSDIKRLDI